MATFPLPEQLPVPVPVPSPWPCHEDHLPNGAYLFLERTRTRLDNQPTAVVSVGSQFNYPVNSPDVSKHPFPVQVTQQQPVNHPVPDLHISHIQPTVHHPAFPPG